MWSSTAPCSTCGLNRITSASVVDSDAVAGRPVEHLAAAAALLLAVAVGDDDVAADHVAPVRRMAGVAVEPLRAAGRGRCRRRGEKYSAPMAPPRRRRSRGAGGRWRRAASILTGMSSLERCMACSFRVVVSGGRDAGRSRGSDGPAAEGDEAVQRAWRLRGGSVSSLKVSPSRISGARATRANSSTAAITAGGSSNRRPVLRGEIPAVDRAVECHERSERRRRACRPWGSGSSAPWHPATSPRRAGRPGPCGTRRPAPDRRPQVRSLRRFLPAEPVAANVPPSTIM